MKILYSLLRPLGLAYASIMYLRRKIWAYIHTHYQKHEQAGAQAHGVDTLTKTISPCISVGNIAWGGTGKTPLVAWILQWALDHKITPAVLSRGYKAKLINPPIHISSCHTAKDVGDEPLMLSLHCQANTQDIQKTYEAHVFVDPNRRRAAAYATKTVQPDLFILDDGMQHIALQRDLELIVLRPEDLTTQWNKVIPEGTWREGANALHSADAFFIKCTPAELAKLAPHIQARLGLFKRPVFSYHLIPTALTPVNPQNTVALQPNQTPYAFITGIGNPRQAIQTITDFMGMPPSSVRTFPDHYNFTPEDIKYCEGLAMPVICTSKDAARIRHMNINFPLFALNVSVEFGQSFLTNTTGGALGTDDSLGACDTFPAWLSAWWLRHTQAIQNI